MWLLGQDDGHLFGIEKNLGRRLEVCQPKLALDNPDQSPDPRLGGMATPQGRRERLLIEYRSRTVGVGAVDRPACSA